MTPNPHQTRRPSVRPGQRITVATPQGTYRGIVYAVHPEGMWLMSPEDQAPPIIPLNQAPGGQIEPAFLGLFRFMPMFRGRRRPAAPDPPAADGWAPGPPFTPLHGTVQPAGPWFGQNPGGAPPSPPAESSAESGSSRGFLGFLAGRNRFWWLPLAFYGLRLFF
ncbi:hypothetical protein [Kyrpidia spormannii]|uniref:Uncharacterized protein n=1 Tax=Kyrpidia spormannii TaxID=2055160 RepID=A0ACA8Z7B0_9BACL|nr:hypothetical protein [Kyrpidia spormannii]CAB3389890.1 conserved protein of unknown function [Kyrpidia spormannii]